MTEQPKTVKYKFHVPQQYRINMRNKDISKIPTAHITHSKKYHRKSMSEHVQKQCTELLTLAKLNGLQCDNNSSNDSQQDQNGMVQSGINEFEKFIAIILDKLQTISASLQQESRRVCQSYENQLAHHKQIIKALNKNNKQLTLRNQVLSRRINTDSQSDAPNNSIKVSQDKEQKNTKTLKQCVSIPDMLMKHKGHNQKKQHHRQCSNNSLSSLGEINDTKDSFDYKLYSHSEQSTDFQNLHDTSQKHCMRFTFKPNQISAGKLNYKVFAKKKLGNDSIKKQNKLKIIPEKAEKSIKKIVGKQQNA